jgi:hypothetical protein
MPADDGGRAVATMEAQELERINVELTAALEEAGSGRMSNSANPGWPIAGESSSRLRPSDTRLCHQICRLLGATLPGPFDIHLPWQC